jgi:tyrosinase co-factor MelC1
VLKRRHLLKSAAGGAAAVGVSAIAVGTIAHTPADAPPAAAPAAAAPDYTETYRGRSIRIGTEGTEAAAWIDGRRLHLMKIGDNAYLSALCHYTVAPTPLHAARTAVDELRGANLLPLGGHHDEAALTWCTSARTTSTLRRRNGGASSARSWR